MATIQSGTSPKRTTRRSAGARAEGKSIQSYTRDEVVTMARWKTKAEALAEVELVLARDKGTGVTVESILEAKDADRR